MHLPVRLIHGQRDEDVPLAAIPWRWPSAWAATMWSCSWSERRSPPLGARRSAAPAGYSTAAAGGLTAESWPVGRGSRPDGILAAVVIDSCLTGEQAI